MSRGYGSRRMVSRGYGDYEALCGIRPNWEGTTGG